MKLIEFVLKSLDDIQVELQMALDGISLEQAMWRPTPQSNSMGWLAWHIARLQDVRGSGLAKQNQLWTSDGWHDRFGLSPDPENHGRGHTDEQVDAVSPESIETLRDYCRVSHELLRNESAKLSDEDLSADGGAADLLYTAVHGGFDHVGQLMYVRGLSEKSHWFPR